MAAAFALEALPPEELDAYRGHLSDCSVCQIIARDFLAVADALPLGLEEHSSPPGLKARILAQAGGGDVGSPTRADVEEQGRRTRTFRWPSLLPPRPRVLVTVLTVLVLGLIAWNVSLQLGLDSDTEPGPAISRQLLIDGIAAGGPVTRLSGTDAAPGTSGALVEIPGSGSAVLLTRNLALLPSDLEYQVWSIEGGVPVSAGTFAAGSSEVQLVTFDVDFSNAEAVGVSIEPIGGSDAPTADAIVMLGTR